MERHAPALLAHELFHHYRDSVEQLGPDKWREELVANTLAIAYCAAHTSPRPSPAVSSWPSAYWRRREPSLGADG